MPSEIYEVIAQGARYWFLFLMALIVWRSFRWYRRDKRQAKKRRKLLPDAGYVGEMVVLEGGGGLNRGDALPVPCEGTLGSLRSNDLCVPAAGVGKRHLWFCFEEGEGLKIEPFRTMTAVVDGQELSGRNASVYMAHGSRLFVGEAVLRLRLFAGFEGASHAALPHEAAPSPQPEEGAQPDGNMAAQLQMQQWMLQQQWLMLQQQQMAQQQQMMQNEAYRRWLAQQAGGQASDEEDADFEDDECDEDALLEDGEADGAGFEGAAVQGGAFEDGSFGRGAFGRGASAGRPGAAGSPVDASFSEGATHNGAFPEGAAFERGSFERGASAGRPGVAGTPDLAGRPGAPLSYAPEAHAAASVSFDAPEPFYPPETDEGDWPYMPYPQSDAVQSDSGYTEADYYEPDELDEDMTDAAQPPRSAYIGHDEAERAKRRVWDRYLGGGRRG